jgi:xanthine phosphoribosyltransferase
MKKYLTWQDIENTAEALSYELRDKHFDGIIAVTKGGMIPAYMLASRLNIDLIETVCVKSYTDDDRQSEMQVIKMINDDKHWLVIDDLVDSGKTFEFLRTRLKNATYAVLYAKPEGHDKTDYYSEHIEQGCWLVFPWEK